MTPRRTSFPGLQAMLDRRRALMTELVAARKKRGLSQTEIAVQMGTSQSAVARLERGDVDARLSTLERYAAALGQTVDWQVRSHESHEESP
ncbi:MAG: helix-turn-helix domain-containing protein [Pseudonocardiaceae bacterium]